MKLTIAIFFAFLLLTSLADVSVSHSNADNQSLLLKFMAPTEDPAANDARIEMTLTSQYNFLTHNDVGAICTVTGADGVFPTDVTSDVFTLTLNCISPSGCTSSFPSVLFNAGTLDGKNLFFIVLQY